MGRGNDWLRGRLGQWLDDAGAVRVVRVMRLINQHAVEVRDADGRVSRAAIVHIIFPVAWAAD